MRTPLYQILCSDPKATAMKLSVLLLCCLLLPAMPLFAREKTDVLIMKNGDHLTCEIKGLDAGVLYVSFDYILGTSSLQWSKVAQVQSKQLFIVKTQDGSVYTGTLDTAEAEAGRPVQIQVLEAQHQEVALDRIQIVGMSATSDKFWHRFNGAINSGIQYSKGNQNTQYNLGAEVEYLRERWSAGANLDSSLAASSGATTSTRNDFTLAAQRLLPWKNYFYAGLADFLQSSEQGIQLQSSLGGGIGRFLKNTNRSKVSLLGGLAWQDIRYHQLDNRQPTQNVAAALVAAKVNFFRFNKTTFDTTAIVFPAISQPGRVQFTLNSTYYVKLFSNLSWNVSFYGNWDNQPPPGFSSSNYGTSSGLSWTFGLR